MDIYNYKFSDSDIGIHNPIGERYEFYVSSDCVEFDKHDVIMLAKHFKLTAHDIDCQSIKNMQDEIDLADEVHFDDLAECRATVMKHNKGIN